MQFCFLMMTHNTANNICERQPSPAPKSLKRLDRHPKPENGTAKFDGSKSCGNGTSVLFPHGCCLGGAIIISTATVPRPPLAQAPARLGK